MRGGAALAGLLGLALLAGTASAGASDFWDAVRSPGRGRHDAELERARLALRSRRFEDALSASEAAARAYPASAEAQVVAGLAVGELGRRADAIASFERALELDPRALDGASDGARAAELAALGGDLDLASRILERVLGRMEAGPRRRTLYALYGDVLQALGPARIRDAIAAYREALRDAPSEDPRAVLGLALALHRVGDVDDAGPLVESLLEVEGLDAAIAIAALPAPEKAARRALLGAARGQRDEAREAWREAQRSEPWRAHAEAALRAHERAGEER